MNKSAIDPSRETVGKIYTDAQKYNAPVTVGDLANELTKSLVDDLNDAMVTRPFGDSPFYICVYEKKDLQMKSAILRRLYKSKYRPFPEDDTVVFKIDPKTQETHFCWCLPHWSDMDNVMMNPNDFHTDMVKSVRAWKKSDYSMFGFFKQADGKWNVKESFDDQRIY